MAEAARNVGPFPEELWEFILNAAGDVDVIRNIFLAFPELVHMHRRIARRWLAVKVLPHLYKHLDRQDILTCRQVCRFWKQAVDRSIERHDDLKPYDENAGKEQITEKHFSYSRLDKNGFLGTQISGTAKLAEFIFEWDAFQGSPFVGNRLEVVLGRNCAASLEQLAIILERFGHNLAHLSLKGVDFSESATELDLCRLVLRCLSHVPNLKSLNVEGNPSSSSSEETMQFFRNSQNRQLFPALPRLETFTFGRTKVLPAWPSHSWVYQLFRIYAMPGNLKKIGMPLSAWDMDLDGLFPNVTELRLAASMRGLSGGFMQLEEILTHLNSSMLRKLCLKSLVGWHDDLVCQHYVERLDARHLLEVLAAHDIQALTLTQVYIDDHVQLGRNYGDPQAGLSLPTVPSLKVVSMFDVKDIRGTYEFLRCFPNLEFFSVDGKDYNGTTTPELLLTFQHVSLWDFPFSDKLRRWLYNKDGAAGRELWAQMPALKMLTVRFNSAGFARYQWAREEMSKPYVSGLVKKTDR